MPHNHTLLFFVVIFCLFNAVHIHCSPALHVDPDETKTLPELINSWGYVLQEYHVKTVDGYILTVHRVVPRDYNPASYNVHRKPVIAGHGLVMDSSFFYFNSPHAYSNTSYCGDNFGFCMVRSGRYDLWVPNYRGNGRSNDHIRYSTKDPQFWAFSWDHMATYDLPAVISLVQARTGHKTMGYVGFSQGCSVMFGLLSLRPQYAKVIRPFIAWAPAVFIGGGTSILGPLMKLWPILMVPGMFPLINPVGNSIFQWHLCRPSAGRESCNLFVEAILGRSLTNVTRLPTYANYGPATASNWQLAHYGQNGQSRRFGRFNYGSSSANMRAYGTPYAPDFPLHNIPAGFKVLIIYGESDAIVPPRRVEQLISLLRAYGLDVTDRWVKTLWSHSDFQLGMEAGHYVYDPTLRYLDMYA